MMELIGKKFLSCRFLEAGLNIQQDFLTHCCIIHEGADGKGGASAGKTMRGMPLIGKFDGNNFPVDMILAARKKLKEDIRAGKDTPCSGCHFLKKKVWLKNRYIVNDLTINDWTECNLRCVYCYNQLPDFDEHKRKKATHDLRQLMEDMIGRNCLSPNATVRWGGGEVAIYKSFEPVAGRLLQLGTFQIVNTNAINYSRVIEDSIRRNKMEVQVSVDAGTRETYLKIKGKDKFDQVWENISRYAKAGKITLKYIVMEQNTSIMDAVKFIDLCKINGVKRVCIAPENTECFEKGISKETLYAVAFMIFLADKKGIIVNDGSNFLKYFEDIKGLISPKYSNKLIPYIEYIDRKSGFGEFFKLIGRKLNFHGR